MNELKDCFEITTEVTSDLSGRLRSHLFDNVKNLFEFEAMLSEDRVRKVVKMRLTPITPVLLSIFASGSSLDNLITSAVHTRYRLAEAGETETLETVLVMEGRLVLTSHPSLTGH